MNIIMILYIIFTFLLTIFNVHLIKKNAYFEALITYRIIDKTLKNKKSMLIMLALDSIYFICYILIALISALKGSVFAFVGLFFVLVIHIGAFVVYDYKEKNKSKLIAYALEKTEAPSSVIEFKVDAYLIEEDSPNYLLDKETVETDKSKGNLKDNKLKKAFPLYRELLTFMGILHDTSVEANSPLVNAYILENITLLSTIMTILKDEKLVESLKNDLGKHELDELTQALISVSKDIKKITTYIKKEKITFAKASDSAAVIESLNKIRSMKEFIELVK